MPKPCLLGATSGQKCYITPTFSGIPNKEDKVKAKKKKQNNKSKTFPMVSLILPADLQTDPTGV